ncbi:MAG TPA: PAS domain S-box protein [Lacunisphaera sp.]|jgi:PAS domain S-box-containing protein|nr:PAS domain S-box protein [Lacunisphaera sp.]
MYHSGQSPPDPSSRRDWIWWTKNVVLAVCAGVTLLSLAVWLRRDWRLVLYGDTVPMAPSTAVLLLLLSIALFLHRRFPTRTAATTAETLLVGFTSLVALVVIWQNLLGHSSTWESWLVAAGETTRGFPVGRMSPLTGASILLTAFALLTQLSSAAARPGVARAGSWAAALGGGFGMVTVLAYASGTPLFYGAGFVPMAFTTALAVAALATALLLEGPAGASLARWWRADAEGHLPASELLFRRRTIAIALASAGALAIAELIYLRTIQTSTLQSERSELEAIASLQAQQVAQWREEREGDALFLARTADVSRDIAALLAHPGDPALVTHVRDWLEPVRGDDRYESVALFDADHRLVLAIPDSTRPRLRLAAGALAGEPGRQPFAWTPMQAGRDGHLHLDLVMAVAGSSAGSAAAPVGLIQLRINPTVHLLPLIRHWPTPRATAETLLLRRNGRELLLLNATSPARAAAPGPLVVDPGMVPAGEEAVDRVDHRGVPVLAAMRPIPGSDWIILAKIDLAEVNGPMLRLALMTAATVAFILLAALMTAAMVWRQRIAALLSQRLVDERERQNLARRLALLLDQANDIILVLDSEGHIIEANAQALATYGYTLEELRRLPPGGLRPPGSGDNLAVQMLLFDQPEGGIFETVHQRKSGAVFAVELGARSIVIENQRLRLVVARDITKRKAHEAEVERLNRYYNALSHVNRAIVELRDRDQLLDEICRVLVRIGGFKMAWIAWTDRPDAAVRPVAVHGDDQGYLREITVSTDERPEGRGPVGTAVREGRVCICNDFAHDPDTGPWREPAARHGFRAAMALPVRQGGGVVGALAVYAAETNIFGPKEVALLTEAADDISFALDNLANEARRRETESQLLLLRAGLLAAPTAVVITDQSGTIEWVNPAFTRSSGYAFAEAVGQTPRLLQSGKHAPEFYADLWRTILDGRVWTGEIVNRRKNGEYFTEDVTIAPVRDAEGRIKHFIAIKVDITDRKHVETALSLERNRLDSLVTTMPDHIYFKDRQSRFIRINQSLADTFGGKPEQVLGKTDFDLFTEEHARQAFADEQRIMATGEPVIGLEEKETWPDGRVTWVSSTKIPLRDAAGEITGLVGISRDITERKRAEQRLREQAECLDQAGEAIVVADLQQRITFWNRGAERIFGYPAAEVLGRTADEFLNLVNVAGAADIRDGVNTAGQWRGEVQAVDRAGNKLALMTSITLVRDDAGQPVARLSISSDLTEQKKLQEQFMRAQRLESVGMLAAGIAHDLNNVLAPVLMAATMLRKDSTDPREQRLLDTVEKSAERGAGLVRQILGFAHGLGGEPRLMQAKHVLRDIAEMIEATFPKSIRLETEIPSDLWPITANPTQIHQVLLNLCVNARDAMPDGGSLTLRAANIILDENASRAIEGTRPGSWIRIDVIDTGAGIPADVLPRIWEPFFTTKRATQGTGLGLATVRGIIATHGGGITVDTKVGRGTCFQVYLPADEASTARQASAQPFPAGSGRDELILVVDDEQSIRDVASAILRKFNYRVLTAADGIDALALFPAHADEIALVIADIDMPNLGGAGLAEKLHEIKPGLKILAITGADRAGVLGERSGRRFAEVLMKPFTAEELLRKVQGVLPAPPGGAT